MNQHVPEYTTLDIAKKRLSAFMTQYSATLKECAQIMGIRSEKELKELMKAKDLHSYSDNVIDEFGADGLLVAVSKLQKLRGTNHVMSKTKSTPVSGVSEGVMSESIHDQAITALNVFQDKYSFNDAEASVALGWSPSNIYQLRKAYADGSLGKIAASNILERIDKYQPSTEELASSKVKALPELAKRMFVLYRTGQGKNVSIRDAEALMNKCKPPVISRTFLSHSLSCAFAPSGIKTMSEAYAEDVLMALASCPWMIDKPVELKPYLIGNPPQVLDTPLVEVKASIVDDTSEDNIPEPEQNDDNVLLAKYFKVSVEDIAAVREQLDALIYARRMNVRAQVTVPHHVIG